MEKGPPAADTSVHFQILGDFCEVFHRNADSEEIDIFPMISRCAP
jgi:hypothetical protein